MPIYEYECQKCGNKFEVMQKMSEPLKEKCSEVTSCEKKGKLAKLISPTAFLLKGGGWYKEGYTNKAGGEKKASDEKPAASSEGAKTEAAPAPAKETKVEAPKKTKSED